MTTTSETTNATPATIIAGIGASAGGLEPLETLFANTRIKAGLAYVVIQHLSPEFESHMADLLGRRTMIPVHTAQHNMVVEADNIYLIPPGKEMTMSGNRLQLADRPADLTSHFPINRFFTSLAENFGENAIGVILSGTGRDGAQGIQRIHEAGGLALSQDINSAQFDGMPANAQATGIIDQILPPTDIPDALIDYVEKLRVEDDSPLASIKSSQSLTRIFSAIASASGVDFSLYKISTVARRLQRRLTALNLNNLEEYCDYLDKHPDEVEVLFNDMLIGVTRFFRDSEAFEIIQKTVLPKLVRRAADEQRQLRLWLPGCSSGEEAYTLAMLVDECMELEGVAPGWKIFATDIHAESLAQAADGVYSAEALAEVSKDRRERYFTPDRSDFRVASSLRDNILFAHHDLLSAAPFSHLDLISCRNLLIYITSENQKRILSLFHFALNAEGALILGPSETPGELREAFEPVDQRWRIYRKLSNVRLPLAIRPGIDNLSREMPRAALGSNRKRSAAAERHLNAYDRLLEIYAPPSLLVDAQHYLLHVFGGAERFLRIRGGQHSGKLAEVIDEDLRPQVIAALNAAARDQTEIRQNAYPAAEESDDAAMQMVVRPVPSRSSGGSDFMISLEPARTAARPEMPGPRPGTDHAVLRAELVSTQDHLRSTVEELETSNEELQATNEELISSNEELQSTNEELQSVNEELFTVNTEYQKNIEALTLATEDMDNLLAATRVGVIFLDSDLCLRRFTPEVGRVFQLEPQDIGRSFDSLAFRLNYTDLAADATAARNGAHGIEREVTDRDGVPYLLRFDTYQSVEGIGGFVIAIVEVQALRNAQRNMEKFKLMSEQSADAHLLIDRDGVIQFANPALAAESGYELDELLDMNVLDLVPAMRDSLSGAEALNKAWQQKVPLFEASVVRKDGVSFPGDISLSAVNMGDTVQMFAAIRNIRQRKETEQQLSLLKRAIDVSLNGVCIASITDDLPLIYVNQSFVDLIGFSREEIIGRNCRFLQGPDTDPADVAAIGKALAAREEVKVTLRNYRKNGTEFWNEVSISPVTDRAGQVTHFVGIQNDVTGEVEQRLMIQANAARLKAVLDSTAEGIYGLDQEGLCTFCNTAALRILGYEHESEVIGNNMHQLIHHHYVDGAEYPHENCRIFIANQNAESVRVDDEVLWRKDGSSFPAEYWSDPLIADGAVVGAVVAFRDISDRIRYQQEMVSARQAAEGANRAKSEFLANMSHEIRTPLSAIMGFSDVLQGQLKDRKQRGHLAVIKRNATHLLDIINDILDLSKVEAGGLELQVAPTSIVDLVSDLYSMILLRAKEKDIELEFRFLTEVPRSIQSDATRLRQILLNLLANAVKFTKSGQACLEVSVVDNTLKFVVGDTGIGMAPDTLSQLFTPFLQGPESRRFGGTGLGLSISKRLAGQLGGDITVSSKLGVGSQFTFDLPLHDESYEWCSPLPPSEQYASAEEDAQDGAIGEAPLQIDGLILVADDQPDIREVAKIALHSVGAAVTTVADGQRAIDAVKALRARQSRDFDLILLDMQMPVKSGFEVAIELRDMGYKGRIIAHTAAALLGERERCIGAGCDDYLSKPVDSTTLLAAISANLQAHDGNTVRRVLVVDDHGDAVSALAELLNALGYTVQTALDGAQALQTVERFRPDVCLLDQNLPDMLGSELLVKLKQLANCRNCTFVAVTGEVAPRIVSRLMAAGFDHHLPKPVDLQALQRMLDNLADRQTP